MFLFSAPNLSSIAIEMRARVRRFLRDELEADAWRPSTNAWIKADAAFSHRCGEAGFGGVALPSIEGGHGRSVLKRYVVFEEVLAASAPVLSDYDHYSTIGPQGFSIEFFFHPPRKS